MTRLRSPRRFVRAGLLLIATVAAGFVYLRLWREARISEGATTITGTLEGAVEGATNVVLLIRESGGERNVRAYQVLARSGPFTFVVQPGAYFVAVFEDANRDLIYDPGERVAHHGGSEPVRLGAEAGEVHDEVRLELGAAGPGPGPGLGLPVDLAAPELRAALEYDKVGAGEVVGIDDPRFTPENGTMGLWEPNRFVREVGFGVYFLAEFSPERIPVLFVHGAGGHPREFEYLISRLDQDRFQPWLFSYPSALRLDRTSEVLGSMLRELRARHGFERLCIVAHSMGGLVARAYVNRVVDSNPEQRLVPLLVTISTPWRGHRAAEWGVELSPLAIPSWLDMTPGSPFQEQLFATTWPALPKHYLLFSFRGGRGLIAGGNDDGAVALASELDYRAQDRAALVYGFDTDHVSILRKERVAERLNEALATVPVR
jgi:pimeloyl-ACP methyl ester carboxylesterase